MATEPGAVPERLVHPKSCGRCGRAIPPGTVLSTLAWDPEARAWSHAQPACAGREGAGGSDDAPRPTPPTSDDPQPREANGRASECGTQPHGPEGPARGSWSVTVEFHEAEDPALSKRVVRIARLHLGTYNEVEEVLRRVTLGPLKAGITNKG